MDSLLLLTVLIIAVVLLFDYTNGFHDAANLVATVIASRAMTPVQAILLAVSSEHIVWGLDEWRSEGHISGVIKVLIGLFLSPLLGFAVGYLIHALAGLVLRSARPSVNTRLRQGQIITTAALASFWAPRWWARPYPPATWWPAPSWALVPASTRARCAGARHWKCSTPG